MKAVKALIWLGFIALLGITIPKTAWVIRGYEGSTPLMVTVWGISIDILWIVPSFLAICIDVLILTLTYAISQDKKRAIQGSMWAFIALLCGVSVYCNLLYNEANRPDGSIWNNPLVSTITPFILACIPLFALCYTLILSRLNGNSESLEDKATRLETEKIAKERIKEINKGRVTNALKNAIGGVVDVTSYALDQLPKKDTNQALPEIHSLPLPDTHQDTPEDRPEIHSLPLPDTHQDTTEINPLPLSDTHQDTRGIENGYSTDTHQDTTEIFTGHTTDKLRIFPLPNLGYSMDTQEDTSEDRPEILTGYSDTSSNGSKSLVYISLNDAAKQYGYSPEYLMKLVSTGKIKVKRNDKSQLLISSLLTYIDKHGRRKTGDTSTDVPTLQVVND